EREGDAKELGGAEGDADGGGEDGEGEEFAGARAGDNHEKPRQSAFTHHQHEYHEQGYFDDGDAELFDGGGLEEVGAAFGGFGEGGDEDEGKYHREVFDDQPADGDAAIHGLQDVMFFEGAEENDGTG